MQVKLVWLMGYGGPYPGSSIPLLRAALDEADRRDWESLAVFGEEAAARPWFRELRDDGYRVETTGSSPAQTFARVGSILGSAPQATILHTHYSRFDMAAALRSLFARPPRPPVFWHVRTALQGSAAKRARNAVRFGLVGRSIDAIFTPSSDLRDQVIARGAASGKVHVLPHGLDTDRFSRRTEAERSAARRELGIDENATVLLHFGWDWHRKGGDLFLEAVRQLARGARDRPLVALSSQGGEEARSLAKQLGIEEQVVVLPATDRVEVLHAAADLVVASSRAEGGMPPFAVAEALSRGTPVVATDIPDHAYAAERTAACRLAAHTGGAIADQIVATLERSPEVAAAEAEEANAWIVREKSMSAWVSAMFGYYDDALRRRGHHGV
ncbi:MAG: glycosyltransferase family 4 protein [Solirubrobacterales bacterium]